MLDLAALDSATQLGRQRLQRQIHVQESRIAAICRHLKCVQQAAGRRQVEIGHVGVPDQLATAERSGRFAVNFDIADTAQFREFGHPGLSGKTRARRQVERTEAPCEVEMRPVVEILSPEPQHQMVAPGLLDLGERRIANRLDIKAADIGSKRRTASPESTPCVAAT